MGLNLFGTAPEEARAQVCDVIEIYDFILMLKKSILSLNLLAPEERKYGRMELPIIQPRRRDSIIACIIQSNATKVKI